MIELMNKAYWIGYVDAYRNMPAKCPYPLGTKEAEEYYIGYHAGSKEEEE